MKSWSVSEVIQVDDVPAHVKRIREGSLPQIRDQPEDVLHFPSVLGDGADEFMGIIAE